MTTTARPDAAAAVININRISRSPSAVVISASSQDNGESVLEQNTLEHDAKKVPLHLTNEEARKSPNSLSSASPAAALPSSSVDPRFVLPKCELPPRHELESVELFVAKAVQEQHHKPDSLPVIRGYHGLIEALRYPKDLPLLRNVLIALRTSNGGALTLLTTASKKHAHLIHLIVRFVPFPPTTVVLSNVSSPAMAGGGAPPTLEVAQQPVDCSVADAHLHLLTALVSANSLFVVPVATALWKMLTFQISEAHPERTRRIHAALATMLRLCPKARTELFPIMSANAPFRLRPDAELLWYYRQCLHVLQYLPSIRGQVLELIIDRCLEVDVEIKITDVGEATIDAEEEDDANLFSLDLEEHDGDTEKTESSPTEAATTKVNVEDLSVDAMAEKLDSLMLVLFEHLEECVANGISTEELFQILLQIFESSIIITHKSKFVQFLILHVCGLETTKQGQSTLNDPEQQESVLYREFAARLIDIVLDPYRATVTRQTGACYLASFVSRAHFVCAETVRESVDALLRWAEAYVASLSGAVPLHAADAREQSRRHSLFYTVCQSAFYIMCFRGSDAVYLGRRDTTTANDDTTAAPSDAAVGVDLGADRWTKICAHPLLPLRYCLESVRLEFLRISKMFSLLEDKTLNQLLEDDRHQSGSRSQRNKKRCSVISTAATLEKERQRGGVGGIGRGTNPLDSFFPFDPYLLRRSHGFIEPFYNHWAGGAEDVLENGDLGDENSNGLLVYDEEDDDDDDGDENDQAEKDTADENEDSDSDSEDESESVTRRNRLLSFASNATSVSSFPGSVDERSMPQSAARQGEQNITRSNSLKRARAPSIESNGSW